MAREKSIIIKREALLPVVRWEEPVDPPPEIASQFKLHDLLSVISYWRERGIEFQTLEQVQERPNFYARARELIDVDAPEERYKGVARHPAELLLTKRHGKRLRPQSKGPEVVALLRELYREGYNLVTPVLQREIKNLYIPMTFLGANAMAADFSYIPSVPGAIELDEMEEHRIRLRFSIPRAQSITSYHLSRYLTDDQPLLAAIFAAGIDAFAAEKEVGEHKKRLLAVVKEYFDGNRTVPAAVVQELRKVFPGRNDFELRYSVVEGVRRLAGEVRYQGTYTADRFVNQFDLHGFEGMGSRNFGYTNPERPLEVRCQDAFARIYQQSQRKTINEQFFEYFSTYFNYLYNALQKEYGSWEKALVAFYGLERITFRRIKDNDLASVAAPEIAECLRLDLTLFYGLAKRIGLPLIPRETRTFPFLHQDHSSLLLERVNEQFRRYQEVKAA